MFYHISYVALSVADKEAKGALTLSLTTFPKSANVSSKSTNLPTVAVNKRQEHAIILSGDQPWNGFVNSCPFEALCLRFYQLIRREVF